MKMSRGDNLGLYGRVLNPVEVPLQRKVSNTRGEDQIDTDSETRGR